MKSAVETLSPTRAKLTVEVPFEELKPSLDAAYQKIAKQINVPGFRRGKVPPAVIDQVAANLAAHPELPDRPAASLAGLTGAAPDPQIFLETLAEAFDRWLDRWRREGLGAVRRRWLESAHPVGTALVTPEGEGLFDGLDETGALRRFVNVYYRDEDIRFLDNIETRIDDGSELSIVPAIAGGSSG